MKKTRKVLLLTGEFINRETEREFFREEMNSSRKYIRPFVLLSGILYFLFIIPDYMLTESMDTFAKILVARSIILLPAGLLYAFYDRIEDHFRLAACITVIEILVGLTYIYINSIYETQDFLIHNFGVIMIILGIFLIPNRWKNMVAAGLLTGSSFFAFAVLHYRDLKQSYLYAGAAYTLLVLIFSSCTSMRVQRSKRLYYLQNMKLERLSNTDTLTGIANRYKFEREFEKWIKLAGRYNMDLSLVIYDFDNFKDINDTYGHLAGDRVIVESTRTVRQSIRENDVFARWGGEEFAIIMPFTAREDAGVTAARIKREFAGMKVGGVEGFTCSFGIAQYRKGDSPVSVQERADMLMYAAKRKGKDRIEIEKDEKK